MPYDQLFQRHDQGFRYIEDSYLDQDAATIDQLRLAWQQFRATQQQTILIELLPGSPMIDESQCVEGSISEVYDVQP